LKILKIVISVFVILESANVLTLYFFPDSKMANSVGIFKAWEKSKADPDIHNFVKYLVNWVAGTKLIFIVLLIVMLVLSDTKSLSFAGGALVFSIATFFWRLYPLIKKMDQDDQIEPQNYSKMLFWMILAMIIIFSVSILIVIID
jgi:hypothetical protein